MEKRMKVFVVLFAILISILLFGFYSWITKPVVYYAPVGGPCNETELCEYGDCIDGVCECTPTCENTCIDDGCGTLCECDSGYTCEDEVCVVKGPCIRDCSCALNLCTDQNCTDSICNTLCEGQKAPDCGDRDCGPAPNGCGGDDQCGTCGSDETCEDGECEEEAPPESETPEEETPPVEVVPTAQTFVVSEEQFATGYTKSLSVNDKIKFNVGGVDHTITFTIVVGDVVGIEIASNPIVDGLKEGEIKKYDINNDGFYDLQVTLNGITSGKADLEVKEINEEIVTTPQSGPGELTCVTEPGEYDPETEDCCDESGYEAVTGYALPDGDCYCDDAEDYCGAAPICTPCGDGVCDKEYGEDNCNCRLDCEAEKEEEGRIWNWLIYILVAAAVFLVGFLITPKIRDRFDMNVKKGKKVKL
ncbi:MAG: hypothetical protein ABIB79_04490 [archaeon]